MALLGKKAKDQEKAKEKVVWERAKLDDLERKRNNMQERLNSTKPIDDVNARESELRRQKAEYQELIDAEDTSPSDREVAVARVQTNEELVPLQTQIAEREGAMLLRERIKEIFKKHGVTVMAIELAAGVTIGAVVGSITNALKASGKAMAAGLKDLEAKLGSLLPGLVSQIAGFISH